MQRLFYFKRETAYEIFADGVKNVHFTNGVVRMDLTVTRMEESPPPEPPVLRILTAARVAHTANAALQLHQILGTLLAALQQQGALPANVVPPPQAPPPAT